MDIFLEKSRELKRQREEEERKLNETLEELNEKKRQQKDAERRKLREAREELFTVKRSFSNFYNILPFTQYFPCEKKKNVIFFQAFRGIFL